MMTVLRRLCIVLVAAAGGLLVLGGPALAQTLTSGDEASSFVVLTGNLDVPEGATFDAAVIFDGPLSIDGTVNGDAVAFNGDVTVNGTVRGDVLAFHGRVTVSPDAQVLGDVTSSQTPVVAPGTVSGTVKRGAELNLGRNLGWPALFGRVLWWVITTGSVFLLGLVLTLLLPRASDALAETALRRVGASAGWGAAAFLGLPILAVLTLVTVVAGLVGGGLLLSLVLIYTVGYTVGALALGRALVKAPKHRFVAFLAGFAILRVVALVPFLGGLCFLLAAGWGLGALIVASFHAGRAPIAPSTGGDGDAAVPPVPPMPALP